MAIVASLLAAVTMVGHRTHNSVLQKQGDSNRQRTEVAAYKVEASNLFARFQAKRLRVEMANNSIISTGLLPAAPELDAARKAATVKWQEYVEKAGDPKALVTLVPDRDPDTLPELLAAGNQALAKAKDMMEQGEVSIYKADHAHHQADWLDLSHLAVELGLVLCSLALLKKRGFLMAGIVAASIGIGLAGYGILLPEHAPDTHSSSQTDKPH